MIARRPLLGLAVASACVLAACSLRGYPPPPETLDGQVQREEARAEMERRCAPVGGEVRRRSRTAGAQPTDYECARTTPVTE